MTTPPLSPSSGHLSRSWQYENTPNMWPRYRTEVWKNMHFSGDNCNPYSLSLVSTFRIRSSRSSGIWENTIKSRKTKTSVKCRFSIHFSINLWNVLGALVIPCHLIKLPKSFGTREGCFVPVRLLNFYLVITRLQVQDREPLRTC